ncbi:SAM-dependent methyltransferase [Nonomuraea wenchangensis]
MQGTSNGSAHHRGVSFCGDLVTHHRPVPEARHPGRRPVACRTYLINPDQIIAQAREILDCTQPIAVMFMGVLGVMHAIIDRVMQAVPSGGYLVWWDGTATGEAMSAGNDRLAEGGAVPYYALSLAELAECFAGLDLVEPGMPAVRRSGRSGNSSTGSDGEFERAP